MKQACEAQRPREKEAVARARLRQAIDRACIARGEAQWTNGYRAARYAGRPDDAEHDRLYRREMEQWAHCGKTEAAAERAMRAYAAAIRRMR